MREALAQPHTKQFLKFAVVGLISFGIDWGMLIALVELFHLDFLMSTTISCTTSVVVNYWLSMKYVFDHREGMSRKREFTIFTILSVIGLGLNDLYMFVGVTFLSIGYQAMKAIATFLVTWYNYFSRRLFLEGAQSEFVRHLLEGITGWNSRSNRFFVCRETRRPSPIRMKNGRPGCLSEPPVWRVMSRPLACNVIPDDSVAVG